MVIPDGCNFFAARLISALITDVMPTVLLIELVLFVTQGGSKESAVEVRRVDVIRGLKLDNQLTYEHFVFEGDVIKLVVHQSLSNNLYAFGNWVCWPCVRCNKS